MLSMASLRFSRSLSLPVSVDELYAWHERPGAFRRMTPPWEDLRIYRAPQGLEPGQVAELGIPFGPLRVRSRFVIEQSKRPSGFVDRQVKGPFRAWEHWHAMGMGAEPQSSVLTDTIRLNLPPGDWAHAFGGGFAGRKLSRVFRYRHRVLEADLSLRRRYEGQPRQTILLTGGTGLIGKNLAALLSTQGHSVHVLKRPRRGTPATAPFTWDPDAQIINLPEDFVPDTVIHLAGSPIAERWTAARKARLRTSRIETTRLLVQYFSQPGRKAPQTFIGASGINYYGAELEGEPVDEKHLPGEDFLGKLCQDWEEAATGFKALGTRVCHLRIGMVLTPAGGALRKLLPAFRSGLGGPIGKGLQPMPWISLDDLIYLFLHLLETPECQGAYNAVAPELTDNRAFTHALGSVLRRPTVFPLPAPVVKLLFGEMGETLLLRGVAAQPTRALESGFTFFYPELIPALSHLTGKG
jgi:uncharacterized protein (TIGR01777 family)